MSGSNRGGYVVAAIAALVAVIILFGILTYTFQVGSTDGYLEAEAKQYQTEYATNTADRIESCSTGTDPVLLRECIEEAITANHENQRDEKDLQAQRNMAEWAFWLLVISVIGVLVTGIGTGFLLWQIMLTREAVEDTGNATKAMVRQNELVEEQMNMAYRPSIKVDLKGPFAQPTSILEWLTNGHINPRQNLKICPKVTLHNIGQSPVYITRIRMHLEPVSPHPHSVEDKRFLVLMAGDSLSLMGNESPVAGEFSLFFSLLMDNLEALYEGRDRHVFVPALVFDVSYKGVLGYEYELRFAVSPSNPAHNDVWRWGDERMNYDRPVAKPT